MLALSNRINVYSVWIDQAIFNVKRAAVSLHKMLVSDSVAYAATKSIACCKTVWRNWHAVSRDQCENWTHRCCGTSTSLLLFIREYSRLSANRRKSANWHACETSANCRVVELPCPRIVLSVNRLSENWRPQKKIQLPSFSHCTTHCADIQRNITVHIFFTSTSKEDCGLIILSMPSSDTEQRYGKLTITITDKIPTKSQFAKVSTAYLLSHTEIWSHHKYTSSRGISVTGLRGSYPAARSS